MRWGGSLTSWVIPFAIGLIAGIVIDYALKIGGAVSLIAVAVPLGAAALTVVGSISAALLQHSLTEGTDRSRRGEGHAESIAENALVWLPNLVFQTDLWERIPQSSSGLCVAESGGNTPVASLKLWRYAEEHVRQDRVLGPRWESLVNHVAERQAMREDLERIEKSKVEAALTKAFGAGWVVGTIFVTPQAPRWYDANVVWNWLQSRRILEPLTDQTTQMNYGRTDLPIETRYNVQSGSTTLLSANDNPVPRAPAATRMIAELQADPDLGKLRTALEAKDRALSDEAEGLRVPASEFYERTVESKYIVGHCAVCP